MRCRPSSDPGYVVMEAAAGASVALHQVPETHRQTVSSPPTVRADSAYKLCFETDDLEGLCDSIRKSGGLAEAPWSWEETTFCECTDPEGNPIQIFSRS